jgi:hypothetical protein
MTKARRKAKIWLLQQEKTFAEIASISGFAEATIHNALDGGGSAKTKQAITNALGIQLWDDVHVTERYITVQPGVSIEFPDVELARDLSNQLSGRTAIQRGRTLTFDKPCKLAILIETPTRKPQTAKALQEEKGFFRR